MVCSFRQKRLDGWRPDARTIGGSGLFKANDARWCGKLLSAIGLISLQRRRSASRAPEHPYLLITYDAMPRAWA